MRRGLKTLRNLLVTALLALVLLASWQFPPFTVRGMCRQMGDALLMTTPEPVFVRKEWNGYFHNEKEIFIIGQTGDTFTAFQYSREKGMLYHPWRLNEYVAPVKVSDQPFLRAYGGSIYCMAAPETAASAECHVTVQQTTVTRHPDDGDELPVYGDSREFRFEGVREAPGVWSFFYYDREQYSWDKPDSEKQLGDLARDWYRMYLADSEADGYAHLHAPVPVELVFRDEAGQELETLHMELDTYELHI